MDHQTAVAQNRAALLATIGFGQRKLGAKKWDPAPDSEATAELANTGTRADGSPWGEDPPRTAYAAANLMTHAVLDNLASLHQLLAGQMPVTGPTVVARSAIEIASGAWWLMEPGIGARARVCRELALSLRSARRARQVAGEFRDTGLDVDEAIEEAEQQEARVLQRAADWGIATPSNAISPEIEGERIPEATFRTARMLRAALPASIPGTAIYRTYSAVTHGEIYGLMNFTAPGVTSDGTPIRHWHLPPDVLDSTIQMAITALGQTWQRIRKVMGWGKLEGDLWEIRLAKIYAGREKRTLLLSRPAATGGGPVPPGLPHRHPRRVPGRCPGIRPGGLPDAGPETGPEWRGATVGPAGLSWSSRTRWNSGPDRSAGSGWAGIGSGCSGRPARPS